MASETSIGALYAGGIPLAQALIKFAPKRLKRAYDWACKRDRMRTVALTLQQIPLLRSDSMDAQTKQFKAKALGIDLRRVNSDPFYARDPKKYRRVAESWKHCSAYENEMSDALIGALNVGKLIAIGYECPRKAKAPPQIIPGDVFSPFRASFGTSEIFGNGLHFLAVRVCKASTCAPVDASKPRGRASRKDEIVSTYERLVSDGKIAPSDPRKVVCGKIRDAIIEGPGDNWGLSDDTIWRRLRPLHRGAAKKQNSEKDFCRFAA